MTRRQGPQFTVPTLIWDNNTKRLPGSAYKLYFYLCYLRSKRFPHPSYSHLCLKLGMNQATLAAAIKALKKANLISYIKGNSHQKKANEYRIINPAGPERTPASNLTAISGHRSKGYDTRFL